MRRLLSAIFFTILSISVQAAPANEERQNWYAYSAWVKELPTDEQTTVILIMLPVFVTYTEKNLIPHTKENKDQLWPMKVTGWGYFMLSQLATKSPELGVQLKSTADAIQSRIQGKITGSDLIKMGDSTDRNLKSAFEATVLREGPIVSVKYKPQIDRTESALIAFSMLAATPQEKTVGALAQDACAPKNVNVCKIARNIADETAKTLPMQLNSNMSIQTVFAEGNTVSMVALLNYTREFLDQKLASTDVSNDKMIKILHNIALSNTCQASKNLEYFVERGGHVQLIYKFNDGTTYTTISITSCASADPE